MRSRTYRIVRGKLRRAVIQPTKWTKPLTTTAELGYCEPVTATAQKIEQEIKELSLPDLVALYPSLVEAMYAKEDAEGLDPAFRNDILRRIDEIDAGRAEGVDAFKALNEL